MNTATHCSAFAGTISWRQTGFNGICNTVDGGEVRLSQSSGQQASLEACQQACIANSQCRSMSYNKWTQLCNQYSTPCSVTKFEAYTKSFSLKSSSQHLLQWTNRHIYTVS